MNNTITKIIHIDMDAFFASVEQLQNKSFQNKPLIVGKGVVTTCSYEARKYGIHSTMLTKKALELCPNAIVIPPNKTLYKSYSKIIKNIFSKYTSKIEQASIDEAYLDVTNNNFNIASTTKLAKIIQKDIYDNTGLTCSCGISYNKFLAKSASNIKKPNGIYVIRPEEAIQFLEQLSIFNFHGIGKKTANKMVKLGIYTGKDLKKLSKHTLEELFQNRGLHYYDIVRGIDNSPIIVDRPLHSVSKEITLSSNLIITHKELSSKLLDIFKETLFLVDKKDNLYPKTLTIKLKYEDFSIKTKSKSLSFHTKDKKLLRNLLITLINSIELDQRVRLYGISISNFSTIDETSLYTDNKQLSLF